MIFKENMRIILINLGDIIYNAKFYDAKRASEYSTFRKYSISVKILFGNEKKFHGKHIEK